MNSHCRPLLPPRRPPAGLVLAVLLGWLALPGWTGQPATLADVQPYLRTARDTNRVTALEVACRRLAPVDGTGPDLWLVAATHLGTKRYYEELQRFLDGQALVLFEAVRTGDGGTPDRGEGYSLQADLAKALGLTFQLDEIDYERPHFRNSDLSLDQLARIFGVQTNELATAAAPGQGEAGAVEFGALVQTMTGEGLLGGLARMGVSLLAASPRMQAATKVAMIEVLGQLPNDLAQISGLPAGMQRLLRVLVEERNEAVVRDLRAALDQRPPPKSVGVFYGAGHMADLELRICRAVGYAPVEDRWLPAFDVDPRALGISAFELDLTARLVRLQLQGLERSPAPPTTAVPAPGAP